MVPAAYITFYTSMATAAATLFGLIFVAISIAPESITTENASLDRQVRATAAYGALLNPLMVGLFALIPYQILGIAVSAVSSVGMINTLSMAASLFQRAGIIEGRIRSIILMAISLVLYGFEFFVALKLMREVPDPLWLSILADLLIFITLFGIIRAWELIGVRRFRLRDWLLTVIGRHKKNIDTQESKGTRSENQDNLNQ